jgi:cytochrome d ubiquinol oxidase subunit I
MAYGDSQAVVRGLDDFPSEDTPPVLLVHLAFQAMVAIGFFLLGISVYTGWTLWRSRQIPQRRLFLWALTLCGPLVVIALEAGWVVTEVGRQPWIVQNVMRTADAVTEAPGIWWVFAVTLAIYTVLLFGIVVVLRLLAATPIHEDAHGP